MHDLEIMLSCLIKITYISIFMFVQKSLYILIFSSFRKKNVHENLCQNIVPNFNGTYLEEQTCQTTFDISSRVY